MTRGGERRDGKNQGKWIDLMIATDWRGKLCVARVRASRDCVLTTLYCSPYAWCYSAIREG